MTWRQTPLVLAGNKRKWHRSPSQQIHSNATYHKRKIQAWTTFFIRAYITTRLLGHMSSLWARRWAHILLDTCRRTVMPHHECSASKDRFDTGCMPRGLVARDLCMHSWIWTVDKRAVVLRHMISRYIHWSRHLAHVQTDVREREILHTGSA